MQVVDRGHHYTYSASLHIVIVVVTPPKRKTALSDGRGAYVLVRTYANPMWPAQSSTVVNRSSKRPGSTSSASAAECAPASTPAHPQHRGQAKPPFKVPPVPWGTPVENFPKPVPKPPPAHIAAVGNQVAAAPDQRSRYPDVSGSAVVQENVVLGDTGCQPTLQLENFIVVRTYLTYPPSHQEEVRLVDLLGICQQPNSG